MKIYFWLGFGLKITINCFYIHKYQMPLQMNF